MSIGNKKKATMNKILFILCLTLASFWMLSCTDYEVASYPKENEAEVFSGTVLDYLSTGNDKLNLKFDSMMVFIKNIPEFEQLLEQEGVQYTVFAIPDACIQSSFAQLNEYRKQKELGGALCVSDLLIEPFVVEDTIVTVISSTLNDTVINKYHYDYRTDVERILCKYIIEGSYNTDDIIANEGNLSLNSLKYDYQMNVECFRKSASGYVGGGIKQVIFSDMKSSQIKENWSRTSAVWYDVYANNGVIHILSSQHNFGFDEFINVFNNYGNEYKK